jgi:hypothetical protein
MERPKRRLRGGQAEDKRVDVAMLAPFHFVACARTFGATGSLSTPFAITPASFQRAM